MSVLAWPKQKLQKLSHKRLGHNLASVIHGVFRPWTQYKHKSTIDELCKRFTYKNTFNFIVIFSCHSNHVVLWTSIRRSKKTNFKDSDGTHADNLYLHLHEYWPIVPWDPWVLYLVHVWMSIKISLL